MLQDDRQAGAEIEITPEMIRVGREALHQTIGYDYYGDGDAAVVDVFEAMLTAERRCIAAETVKFIDTASS